MVFRNECKNGNNLVKVSAGEEFICSTVSVRGDGTGYLTPACLYFTRTKVLVTKCYVPSKSTNP